MASCRALFARSGCPETVFRLQLLGSCDVGVASVECKKLFVVPLAASPSYVLPVDLHLPHVSRLLSRFDPLPLSIAFRTLGVVEASSHLLFRAAGVARYLLTGSALIGDIDVHALVDRMLGLGHEFPAAVSENGR